MSKKRKTFAVILILFIFLTVAFIWSNSLFGKVDSAKNSQSVYDTVVSVFSSTFGNAVSNFIFKIITHNVFRKFAHVFEFFLLGTEFSLLYICLYIKKPIALFIIPLFGLVVSAFDETIQIFSNRGASVFDVLIDMLGYLIAFTFIFIFAFYKKQK